MDVVILGGGISGLMASAALQMVGASDITIIDPGPPGGAFLKGGFKYLHATKHLEYFLSQRDIAWTTAPIKGGILIDGEIKPYPAYLTSIPKPQALAIMRMHYEKTRGREAKFSETAMNDPWGPKPNRLCLDFKQLVGACLRGVKWVNAHVEAVEVDGTVKTNRGSYSSTHIVNTLPLWLFGGMLRGHEISTQFKSAKTNKLNVFRCMTTSEKLSGYDYVYTPRTPANMVHRVSDSGHGLDFETARPITQLAAVFEDINSIIDGVGLAFSGYTSPGHIMPDPSMLEYIDELPRNWLMAGRYAAWDARCTADKVYESVHDWAKQQ